LFFEANRSNNMTPPKSPTSTQTAATAAKRTANDVADQTRAAAKNAAQTAKTQANAAKSSVADEMSGVASALRTAAEQMRNGSAQERTFGQIAEGLADASDAVRDKDLSTMVQDVTVFARKNPLVFLSGAALIGFAATRFAKASSPADTDLAASPANGDVL
jgi:uncharacterized phage infection (PIP) family protein YhgE